MDFLPIIRGITANFIKVPVHRLFVKKQIALLKSPDCTIIRKVKECSAGTLFFISIISIYNIEYINCTDAFIP